VQGIQVLIKNAITSRVGASKLVLINLELRVFSDIIGVEIIP
jgi:hypothetical protein